MTTSRRPVLVFGARPGPGWELALALSEPQDVVFVSSGGDALSTGQTSPVTIAGSWDGRSPDDLAKLLSEGSTRRPAVAVWAETVQQSGQGVLFESIDETAWVAQAEEPITRFRRFLQAIGRVFGEDGGTIIALLPSSAITGAGPGFVPWVTAAEGQRALIRVAARGWGARRVRAYSLAVTPDLLVGDGTGGDSRGTDAGRLRPGLRPRAIGRRPSVGGDVAAIVRALLAPEWESVTGLTVGVDGGSWMTP